MGRKRQYELDVIVTTVTEIIDGRSSVWMKANELELSQSTIRIWIAGYEKYGIEYFESRPRNQSYTKEFKEMVIH